MLLAHLPQVFDLIAHAAVLALACLMLGLAALTLSLLGALAGMSRRRLCVLVPVATVVIGLLMVVALAIWSGNRTEQQPATLLERCAAMCTVATLLSPFLGWLAAWIVGSLAMVGRRTAARAGSHDDNSGWAEYLARPAPATAWGKLIEGLAAPRAGLSFLGDHRRLWAYAAWPTLVNVFLSGMAMALFLGLTWWLWGRIDPWFAGGWWWRILEVAAVAALVAVALALTLAVWLLAQGLLCDFFFARLAMHVELALGTPATELRELPMYEQAIDAVKDTTRLLTVQACLLLLNLVPLVGPPANLIAGLYYNCRLFGSEYLTFALDLRGRKRLEKLAILKRWRSQSIGLGATVLAGTLVPVLGSILLTMSVVGAVLLHRRLIAREALVNE